jgi:hypothetical protein
VPILPSDGSSSGVDSECSRAADCDPSGGVECVIAGGRGMCAFGNAPDISECEVDTDCDPSGALTCDPNGFCSIDCNQRNFELGICE